MSLIVYNACQIPGVLRPKAFKQSSAVLEQIDHRNVLLFSQLPHGSYIGEISESVSAAVVARLRDDPAVFEALSGGSSDQHGLYAHAPGRIYVKFQIPLVGGPAVERVI